MNLKKTYLTMEEIAEIVDKMVVEDFSYNREVVKIALVAQCCFEYDFSDMNGVDIYNLLAQQDLITFIEDQVTNYYIIDKMVREERSIETSIINSLKKLEIELEKYSKKIPKITEMESLLKVAKEMIKTKEDE